MLVRPFLIFLALYYFALDIIAQKPTKTVFASISVDTLRSDSLKVLEDAPLDIAQNRGLFYRHSRQKDAVKNTRIDTISCCIR